MPKHRLALIYGGISSERKISLTGGKEVHAALDKDKYEITVFDPKTDIGRLVADAAEIDSALIILHGPFGEDGTIQGLLDLLGIPYQGSGVIGSAMCMQKAIAKKLYEKSGLPVPPYIALEKKDHPKTNDCIDRLGLPIVVKPTSSGSSIGMSIIRKKEGFQAALESAFNEDDSIILEAFIEGTEITASVLGNTELESLPLIEIIPGEAYSFFDYQAKYQKGATREICPAQIDATLTEKAQSYARMAHVALCCRGYSRTDMICKGHDIYILETNTIPGMTQTSLFPQAAKAAGYSFSQMLDRLIALSLDIP